MRTLAPVSGLAAVLALFAGCSLVTGQPVGQTLNDITMTTTVKSRLARAEGIGSLTGIHVRTHNDMVYLTGTVADAATRDRIDRFVRNIAGHNRVTDQLVVAGETARAAK